MSKKKKQRKTEYDELRKFLETYDGNNKSSKKRLNREFEHAMTKVRDAQLTLYELDKMENRRQRKAINKKEAEYYYNMDAISERHKMLKSWKKTGFLDTLMLLLDQVVPIVQLLARLVCSLITTFLSQPSIKNVISPKMMDKLTSVFNFAISV